MNPAPEAKFGETRTRIYTLIEDGVVTVDMLRANLSGMNLRRVAHASADELKNINRWLDDVEAQDLIDTPSLTAPKT